MRPIHINLNIWQFKFECSLGQIVILVDVQVAVIKKAGLRRGVSDSLPSHWHCRLLNGFGRAYRFKSKVAVKKLSLNAEKLLYQDCCILMLSMKKM